MHSWLAPVARYFWHSLPANYRRIVSAPPPPRLILRSNDDHAPLIAAANTEDLIVRRGFIQAYRSGASLEAAIAEADAENREFGVPFAALDAAGLATIEPNLRVPMQGAIHFTGPGVVATPANWWRGMPDCSSRAAAASKGCPVARAIGQRLECPDLAGTREASDVVVALGPWTPQFLAPLGYRIPMVLKRGYHWHFACDAEPLQPFMDVANATVISPITAA